MPRSMPSSRATGRLGSKMPLTSRLPDLPPTFSFRTRRSHAPKTTISLLHNPDRPHQDVPPYLSQFPLTFQTVYSRTLPPMKRITQLIS